MKHPVCIVLIGAQGSGKGTLVKHFEDKGFVTVTMSDAIRDWVKYNPQKAKKYGDIISVLDSGELVSDEATKEAFEWKIRSIPIEKNIVLDGCIRTPEQVHSVVPLLAFGFDIIFIEIICPRFICEDRIKNRVRQMMEQGLPVREDDIRPWKVKKRLDDYEGKLQIIKSLIKRHYRYKIYNIDGKKSIENVAFQADAVLVMENFF